MSRGGYHPGLPRRGSRRRRSTMSSAPRIPLGAWPSFPQDGPNPGRSSPLRRHIRSGRPSPDAAGVPPAARAARARSFDSTGGSRVRVGRGARGGGRSLLRGGGAVVGGRGRAGVGVPRLRGPHALRANPEPASLRRSHAGHVQALAVGRRGGGAGGGRSE